MTITLYHLTKQAYEKTSIGFSRSFNHSYIGIVYTIGNEELSYLIDESVM